MSRVTAIGVSAALAAVLLFPLHAEELVLRWTGSELHVAISKLGILTGAPLERLRSGRAVIFNFQLDVSAQGIVLRRAAERFIVSYDLWEERFSVTRPTRSTDGGDADDKKSVSQLTADAAEAWCLEHLSLSTQGLDENRALTVRLEVRQQEPRDDSGAKEEPGISLTALIQIFSRPARTQEASKSWQRTGVRLAALKKEK